MFKTILITGSSRGIGASLARLAKKEGYNVILHGRKLSKNLKLISKELNSKYLTFDVNNDKEIKQSIKNIKKIDILVNSAGINISKTFIKLSNDDWRSVYNTNIFGVARVIRHVLPILNKSLSTAKIINIASVKGTYSAVGHVAYASSKAALINLTTGLAKELAPRIAVNSVSPGFVSTDMTNETFTKRVKKQVNSILLKRIAKPDEIANVILFLCSVKCSYITGQNIIVDGGFGIKNE
jgi:3-oxoacyl-[acyl-carrier protein] reductase